MEKMSDKLGYCMPHENPDLHSIFDGIKELKAKETELSMELDAQSFYIYKWIIYRLVDQEDVKSLQALNDSFDAFYNETGFLLGVQNTLIQELSKLVEELRERRKKKLAPEEFISFTIKFKNKRIESVKHILADWQYAIDTQVKNNEIDEFLPHKIREMLKDRFHVDANVTLYADSKAPRHSGVLFFSINS